MNVELKKPQHMMSLASSGFLVSVDVNVWSATKQDRAISDEVTTAKRADPNAGKYTKHLLANHPKHRAVVNYRQTIYNWVKRRTYRWNDAQDYLPAVDMPKFKQEYNEHKARFEVLRDEFIDEYDSIVSDMAFKQGDMFCRDDYPPKEKLVSRFAINLYVSEVPLNDFRCQVTQEIADDLFDTYSKQTQEIVNHILMEQKSRFIDVVESISHCCGYDESVDAKGDTKIRKRKIYDSTINKALEMCDTFRDFNLTDDQDLEEARAMLRSALLGVTAEQIRDSEAARESVKDDVDAILSKFGAFKCV